MKEKNKFHIGSHFSKHVSYNAIIPLFFIYVLAQTKK